MLKEKTENRRQFSLEIVIASTDLSQLRRDDASSHARHGLRLVRSTLGHQFTVTLAVLNDLHICTTNPDGFGLGWGQGHAKFSLIGNPRYAK